MLREAIVRVGVVREQELVRGDAAEDDVTEHERRLLLHGVAQRLVEGGEELRVRHGVVDEPCVEPLAREVVDERAGLRVGEHARHLRGELRLVGELAGVGGGRERVVGHRAPQEVREAGRDLVARERVRRERGRGRVELDAIKEVGRHEHGLHRQAHAGLPGVAVRARDHDGGGDERVGLGVRERAPPRATAEGAQHRARAGLAGALDVAGDDLRALRARERLGHERLGGGLVELQVHGRDGEDIGDVVEAEAAVIGRELVGGRRRGAEEVADGVVVLGAVEAVERHPARIAAERDHASNARARDAAAAAAHRRRPPSARRRRRRRSLPGARTRG